MMSNARDTQIFLGGRSVVGLLWWLAIALVGSSCLWPFPLAVRFFGEAVPRYVSSVELLLVACIAGAAWCVTPRMATWDAQGGPHVRRRAVLSCLVVLVLAWCIAVFFVQFGYHLPFSLVSREGFSASDFPVDRLSPAALGIANRVVVVGSLTISAAAIIGRVPGTVMSAAAYVALLYLERSSPLFGVAGAGEVRSLVEPSLALLLPIAATFIWWVTTGTGALARRLDPRS